MVVKIIGKNIEITEALKNIVEKKISRLDRYFDPSVPANVTLSVQKNDQIIEVTIPFNGVILRGEETNPDMYVALDLVLDKIERQIRKQKTKLARRKGSLDSIRFSSIPDYEWEKDEKKDPTIVKTKRFAIKPMAAEEAILQMELLGHSFFVYQDAETSDVNVVYKRNDGNYGLIEPEF
ncbi:ribosome hibernation-promoting factor, HPF/YfiA family [Haloimpatiens lingqiaonensis]|uniref:ribosome hibernation-promoting factor, HPF/YfiA family n=1 Tax=Haloimpatiens lingqiaonensis TaxID=1380675 RepID=UPI0010FEC62B|nr:ribosome-associated translation inhibitor RaiA [Haloimpatiens lingqiaonensis]